MMNRKWTIAMLLAALLCCAMVSCALAAQPVEITSTVDHGDGKVTIHWNNPNGGNVTVASMLSEAHGGNMISLETNVSGSSYTFEELAPGYEHILLAMPGFDTANAGVSVVTVKTPPEFDNFRLTLKESYLMYAVFREDGDYTYNYAKDLSPKKIQEMLEDKSFLVRLDFRHPTFSSSRTLPILTVVTSPTGYVATDYRDFRIPADCIGFWQTTLHMNGPLQAMYEENGSIPTGRYKVQVYVDGETVGETTFTLN